MSLRQRFAVILMDHAERMTSDTYKSLLEAVGEIPESQDPLGAEDIRGELRGLRSRNAALEAQVEGLQEDLEDEHAEMLRWKRLFTDSEEMWEQEHAENAETDEKADMYDYLMDEFETMVAERREEQHHSRKCQIALQQAGLEVPEPTKFTPERFGVDLPLDEKAEAEVYACIRELW